MLEKHGDALTEICVVLPTHRAAQVFKHSLAAAVPKPVFAPRILPVRDFITDLSGLDVTDDLRLVTELYRVSTDIARESKRIPEEPFDKFYGWGEMMLADFSAIDMEMVDPQHLFRNITDLKRIESEFGLDPDDAQQVAAFWQQFSGELQQVKRAFVDNWEMLYPVYRAFRTELEKQGLAYEGMAWQKALEQITAEQTRKWKYVYFAGFYGISRVHRRIIEALEKHVPVESLYDADSYYTDDTGQEAGFYFHYFRKPPRALKWKGDYIKAAKQIEVTGLPLTVAQARYAGTVIRRLVEDDKADPARIGVVLPDEQLLMPLLHSLPESAGRPSVSVGYPLRMTGVASLLDIGHALHRQGGKSFPTMDVLRLLEHPYAALTEATATESAREALQKEKSFRVPREHKALSLMPAPLRALAGPHADALSVATCLSAFMEMVTGQPATLNMVEYRAARQFLEKLQALVPILEQQPGLIGTDAAWLLLKRMLRDMRTPIPEEGADGPRIMGLLETRALDFETVIILSANEGTLPPSGMPSSYIPYTLRKGFGIPGYEERDAVYAYHFYRLLQQSKQVYIVYDTEVKSLRGGEKSRYLYQLAYELPAKAPEVSIDYKVASGKLSRSEPEPIRIDKTEDILAGLAERCFGDTETTKGLSPSALGLYIHCPLKFYFRYVAGIEEYEMLSGTVEADKFGQALHSAMEKMYGGEQEITEAVIGRIKKHTKKAVGEAFADVFPHVKGAGEGVFYLSREILQNLVQRILKADSELAPFRIDSLEKQFKAPLPVDGRQAVLTGFIDRVHVKDDIHAIVDYKSGGDEIKDVDTEKLFTDPKLKAMFQLLCYSLAYRHAHPDKKFTAGIYKVRSLAGGIQFLNEGQPIEEEMLKPFEARLATLVREIMDPEAPFTQTEDVKRCEFCAYRDICNR